MAHAVQVDDLIARLNYIRKNGELGPLDAAPAYVTLPPPQVVIRQNVTAAAPAGTPPEHMSPPPPPPAPAAEKTEPVQMKEDTPPPEKTIPAEEPEREQAPVPVPSQKSVMDSGRNEDHSEHTSLSESVSPCPVSPSQENGHAPGIGEFPKESADERPHVPQPRPLQSGIQQPHAEETPDEDSSDESEDAAPEGDPESMIDIKQILGKRKSVEELIAEVKEIPIVNDIVRSFGGRLVDVHEIAEDPDQQH